MGISDYFLNFPMLWGTLGVLVPIAIHLLNRYRHREIDWAAMELLRRALVVRARQVRLEDILVLVLRCLAVLFLALAMARPRLPAEGARMLGLKAQPGVVIALDGSFSMAHRPGVNSRFHRALGRVREILATLKPGNPLSLVLMGSQPRILLRNVGYDEARLEKVLAELKPLPERLNLELCLEETESLVREIRAPVRECYIVTDAQATTWKELSEKAKLTLREIANLARLSFLSVGSENGENLAITHFDLASGTLHRGAMARFVVGLRNFGRRPQERVTVKLAIDGVPVDQRTIDVAPPGQSQSVSLFARFTHAGDARLTASITSDALTTDNVRHAVALVREQVRVLCVDGEPSQRPYESETDYLATALAPRRGTLAGPLLAVRRIPWLALGSERLADYQVVILANVPDIRRDQAAALHTYVRQGGGLILFLGDKIIPRLVNARLAYGGESLLPARLLSEAESKGEGGVGMELAMAGHPIVRGLEAVPRELFGAARFSRYFRVKVLKGGRTVLKLAGTDDPLLVEKSFGLGRVVLFTSSADREWNNLPVNPLYPILLHQSVTYLLRREHERSFTVGEPLTVSLPPGVVGSNVLLRDPTGKDLPLQVAERDGQKLVNYASPEQPGFCEIRYAAGLPPLVVAVNVEPTESDVRSLVGGELTAALRGLPLRILGWGEDLALAIRAGRVGHELWRTLLILAIVFLVLEAFLARYFTRRSAARGQEVAASAREALLGGRPSAETRS